jgi:trimeric autotransporter adhesin
MGREGISRPRHKVTSDKIAAGVIVTADVADLGITAAKLAADAVETTKILNSNVTAAKIADGILTGAKVAVLADDAVVGGIPVVINVAIADGVTADKDVVLTHKTEILDVIVQKRSAAGGASDTITVKNGATAITNDMDINVADKTIVRAGTIDDAQSTIAAAGTLRITKTKASANNVACQVTIRGVRRT